MPAPIAPAIIGQAERHERSGIIESEADMSDFLKRANEPVSEAIQRLRMSIPEETLIEAIKRRAEEIVQAAKVMQPVQTSCPHLRICRFDEKHEYLGWKCYDCGERVYPDPEGLKHGFLEYGRKRGQDDV